MRRSGLVALALAVSLPVALEGQEPMALDELVQRGDTYLHPRTFEPFTGDVLSTWTPDIVQERGTLVDGKWDGVHEWYHSNGRLSTRETYVNGRLNGVSESYFKSGQLSTREVYGNGQLNGPYEAYWNRGRLAESGAWTSGEPCGNWLSFGRTMIYPPCPA